MSSRTRRRERSLEAETRIVEDAISMVATGASRRVIVANLRHPEDVVGRAAPRAAEAHVRLGRLAVAGGAMADIVVEPEA